MNRQSQKSIAQGKQSEGERAYGCPCGKNYLSYPALFTHVKQKHEGKPPGKLIKPKTGKIRGRPKTRVNPQQVELHDINNRIQHDLPELVQQLKIQKKFNFQRSEGMTTCQDAASNFLEHFEYLGENGISVLECFITQLKSEVQQKFGAEYWKKQKPSDIIEVANTLYTKHEENYSAFPIPHKIFKELIYNFFEWLYANKYSDHRLLKKVLPKEDELQPYQ